MDIMIHQKIVNEDKYFSCLAGARADCAGDSLEMWWKLRNVKPVRVRGKRTLEQEIDLVQGNQKNYHYWVESKGIIFEEHGGVRQIFRKEDYYKRHSITHVDTAPYKCFFADELPAGEGYCDMVLEFHDIQLLHLIYTYKNKQDKL